MPSETKDGLIAATPITDGVANDQLLYFTSPTISADGRTLVVLSDAGGDVNLHAIDLSTGRRRALTDNREGYLKSYVYFDGRHERGIGKASVSLDPARGVIYFVQDSDIRAVTLDGQSRAVARLPEGEATAFTHVSADGRWLCVPTVDARALAGPFDGNRPAYDVDQRIRDESVSSYLNIYDTQTGECVAREPVPGGWVTHVQFSPRDARQLLYNHEWAHDSGRRRIWLWDGDTHRELRPIDGGRSAEDWVCHEVWIDGGDAILYHGKFTDGRAFVGRLTPGGDCHEIALPDTFTGYGHFTTGGDRLVSDGYFRFDDDAPSKYGQYIATLRVDFPRGVVTWHPLCRHGSTWSSQDAHPHPVFTPDGESVLFTSDVSGRRRVYRADASATPS